MSETTFFSATEALADAWATADGKQRAFRIGRLFPEADDANGGHYAGYLADAQTMIGMLERRGYVLVAKR